MAKNIKLILAIIGIFVVLGIVGSFTFIKIPQEALDTTATGKFCHAQIGSAKCTTFDRELWVADLSKLGIGESTIKTFIPVTSLVSTSSSLNTNPQFFLCNEKMANCKLEVKVKKPSLDPDILIFKIIRANGAVEFAFDQVSKFASTDANDGLYHYTLTGINTLDKVQVGYYDQKLLTTIPIDLNDIDFNDPRNPSEVAVGYKALILDIIRADGFREPDTIGFGCNLQALNNAFSEIKVQGNNVIKQVENVGISASDAGCTYSSCAQGQTLNWVQNFICSDSIIQSAVNYQGKDYICEVGVKAQLWEMGSIKIGTTDYKIIDKPGPLVNCCPGVNYGDKTCNKDFQLVPNEDITLSCTSSKQCANAGDEYVVNGEEITEACVDNICKVVKRKAVECDGFTKFCPTGSVCSPLTNTCVTERPGDVTGGCPPGFDYNADTQKCEEEKTFLEKYGIFIIGSIIALILFFIAVDNKKGGKKRK